MLSAILVVTKLIGIILAALLGLLLVLLLIVGFLPITYKGNAAYKDSFKSTNTASWLFGIFGMRFGYDKGPYAVLRIFKKKFDFFKDDEVDEDINEDVEKSNEGIYEDKTVEGEATESGTTECGASDIKAECIQEISESANNKDIGFQDKEEQNTEYQNIEKQSAATYREENLGKDKSNKDNKLNDKSKAKKKRHRVSVINRIKKRLKRFREHLLDKLRHINEKKAAIISFVRNPDNQRLFRFLKKSLKRLLGHILPRRTKGHVLYGFDDPYYTGKLLSYISLFPIAYNKDIKIIPAFDKQVMEFDFNYKGHIQLAVVAYILLRVWFDKDFKRVYNEYKNR